MKVSKAKTKVCPFMSVGFAADTPELRSGGLIEITCVCGDCMAWQFTEEKEKITEPGQMNRRIMRNTASQTQEGYCRRLNNE